MRQTSTLRLTLTKVHWWQRGLRLYDGKTQVGKVEYTRRFKMDAVATIMDERWKIRQSGFWKSSFEFSTPDQSMAPVTIRPNFGGKVEWKGADGKIYTYRKIKWWKHSWAWFDMNENTIMEIRPDFSFSNKQAQIIIHNSSLPDIPVMTLIGIFIFQLQKARAAASAT